MGSRRCRHRAVERAEKRVRSDAAKASRGGVIVWRHDRVVAALEETVLQGVVTNQGFLLELLRSDAFERGETFTHTVEDILPGAGVAPHAVPPLELVTAAALLLRNGRGAGRLPGPAAGSSPWQTLGRWRLGERWTRPLRATAKIRQRSIGARSRARPGTGPHTTAASRNAGVIELEMDGAPVRCAYSFTATGVWVSSRGRTAYFERETSRAGGARARTVVERAGVAADEVRAPMTGTIVELRVTPGTIVARDDRRGGMEAIKMESAAGPREGQNRGDARSLRRSSGARRSPDQAASRKPSLSRA